MKREGGYGLEILARFRFYGPKKATQWLKTRPAKIKEQLRKHTLLPQNISFLRKNGFVIPILGLFAIDKSLLRDINRALR